jgi:hypothetical protein
LILQRNRTSSFQDRASSPTAEKSDPFSKLHGGKAYSMLMKLVAESDSKSIAFTEEVNILYITSQRS